MSVSICCWQVVLLGLESQTLYDATKANYSKLHDIPVWRNAAVAATSGLRPLIKMSVVPNIIARVTAAYTDDKMILLEHKSYFDFDGAWWPRANSN